MANKRINQETVAPSITNTMCFVGEDPNVNTNATYKFPITQIVDGTTIVATAGKYGVGTSAIVDATTMQVNSNVASVKVSGILDGTTLGATSNVAHVNTSAILDGTTLSATANLAHVVTSGIVDGTTLGVTGNAAHVITSGILDGSTLNVTGNLAHAVPSAFVDNRSVKATSGLLGARFSGASMNHVGSTTYAVTGTTTSILPYDQPLYDTDSYCDISNSRFIVPWTGYYGLTVAFVVNYTTNTDTSIPLCVTTLNGADLYTVFVAFNYNTSAQTTRSAPVCNYIEGNYTAGDLLAVKFYNPSNTTLFVKLNVADVGVNPAFFQIRYLGT